MTNKIDPLDPNLNLDCQFVSQNRQGIPDTKDFEAWVRAVLSRGFEDCGLSIRVVDAAEIQQLNLKFRGQDRPTNVLSFPMGTQDETGAKYLGDIVICEPVVVAEAKSQAKLVTAHWAHMTVHGVLHLLGFDHKDEEEARSMEAQEVEILASLGYQDPYEPMNGG